MNSMPPLTTREPLIPPSYTAHALDLTAAFSGLNLDNQGDKPTESQCIAHLKLLELFHQLREDIGTTDGLFGMKDSIVLQGLDHSQRIEVLAKVREKRWAVYVTKATLRFEKWWRTLSSTTQRLQQSDTNSQLTVRLDTGRKIRFTRENLPPLDVIMVWHSYMLNPRSFLEDCLWYGKMDLWTTGLPWEAINDCINNESFDFVANENARIMFNRNTGLAWDCLEDECVVPIKCPNCKSQIDCPLTTWWERECWRIEKSGSFGDGFADPEFSQPCRTCRFVITHDHLRMQKLRNDVQSLLVDDLPMPGTVLSIDGLPEEATHHWSRKTPQKDELFPNRLIKDKLRTDLLELTDFQRHPGSTIENVRDMISRTMQDTISVMFVNDGRVPSRRERVAIRRMLASYWYNSSPFALDLVGAVIRQGSFIEKMHSIDWLHSPALQSTMSRLIQKYERYFMILAKYPSQTVVPTLDVDLAWHTHQLSPKSYFDYSQSTTLKLIDHDDKIPSDKLSTAFAWTSKTYEKLFKQVYSECTCWYCAAIRESHTSTLSSLLPKKSTLASSIATLHSNPDSSNPHTNPHISSHNAITPIPADNQSLIPKDTLDRDYHRACRRAKRENRPVPSRDAYTTTYAYGVPLYVGVAYTPCMGDPCLTQSMYVANPACASCAEGAVGNCAAGSCGGGVASGACAGGGSSGGFSGCGGGSSGGCGGGGGGGGGCGGGGGGGC